MHRNKFAVLFVLFLGMILNVAWAQDEKFELRMVQESVDCASRKIVFSAQIRATSTNDQFIMGPASLLFETSPSSLTNPTLLSKDNFSGGRYSELVLTTQGNISTLSIVYQGTSPYTDVPNVTTDWTSIAHISFDIPAASDGCYTLSWKNTSDFPGSEFYELIISGGTASFSPISPALLADAEGCAFESLLPVATISGDTAIYDGEMATLKVNFSGATPVSIALDGVTYNNLTQSPLLVNIFPTATTTYTLDSVYNACGTGTSQGSATVTILQAGLTTLDPAQDTVCAGTVIQVPFTSTGVFGVGNTFIVQLSDATGSNFTDISTTGSSSPLSATIPANTPAGTGYRVRVVASSPALVGDSSGVFAISGAPTALLAGGATIPAGGSANLSVTLTGKAPWNVVLSDNSAYTTSTSPLTISVTPASTTIYSLLSVADACSSGTASGSATVTVVPATDPCKTICVPVTFKINRQ